MDFDEKPVNPPEKVELTKKDLTTRCNWVFDNFWTHQNLPPTKKFQIHPKDEWKVWNGAKWKECFNTKDTHRKCSLRCLALQSTINTSRSKEYYLHGKKLEENLVKFDETKYMNSITKTEFYTNSYKYNLTNCVKFEKPATVKVINGDCVDTAFMLQDQTKKKVAVLNMANRWEASGGWPMRWGTQEEQLFRRSNLYQCLDNEVDGLDENRKWKYPIDEYGQIFSPEVVFFRSGEDNGYNFILPRHLGIITAAAVASPSRYMDKELNELRMKEFVVEITKIKISNLFKVCIEQGYTNVILSAWGSGAFRTPPKHMAELFKLVLKQYENYFENVWFAIFEDAFSYRTWNEKGNLKPYEEVFDVKAEKLSFQYKEFGG